MPVIRIKKKRSALMVRTSPETIESFEDTFDNLSEVFVERLEEIQAIKYCLLSRSHLMLEGKHGIAKSMFADHVFKRITGARVFKKQFMERTTPDEIFGPMDSKRYREKAEWHHNTAGMLPEAHFFFGDEIYRASDQILPAMLGVLNEHEFINGTEHMQCPLITGIGTTNFVIDDEKLEAFHDRWHTRIEVQALTAPQSISKLLFRFLREENAEYPTFSLDQLLNLQIALKEVSIEKELLDLYARFTVELQRALNCYVSDRRKCVGLRFLQASALINGRNSVVVEDFAAARFALITVRRSAQESVWANAYSAIVGDFQQSIAEVSQLRNVRNWLKSSESKFNGANTPRHLLEKMLDQAKTAHKLLENQPITRQLKTITGQRDKAELLSDLVTFIASVAEVLPREENADELVNQAKPSWFVDDVAIT